MLVLLLALAATLNPAQVADSTPSVSASETRIWTKADFPEQAPSRKPKVSGSSAAYYPIEAVKRHEQGRVVMELAIGKDGSVSQCRVLKSTKSATLDKESCRISLRQLHYAPAKDTAGNPVDSKVPMSINWVLPR
jgi:TonB family protein